MITVYIGDVGKYLSSLCCSIDATATLLTQENCYNLLSGLYYTSIGDLQSLVALGETLRQADKIVYAPPTSWSDEKNKKSKMQEWTEDYLNVFKFRCKVENYTSPNRLMPAQILTLEDQRKTISPQLWIAGCSVSHGIGVDLNARYGQLLANQLTKEVSFLTKPSSSISWAADQILRSDIRRTDIVVWGITTHTRLTYFEHDSVVCITSNTGPMTECFLEYLTSDHVVYQSVVSIGQVINFCKKSQATLVIASLLDDVIVNYIQDIPNLIMLFKLWGREQTDRFPDVGYDKKHPGINSHKFYANQIYQKIQELVVK